MFTVKVGANEAGADEIYVAPYPRPLKHANAPPPQILVVQHFDEELKGLVVGK